MTTVWFVLALACSLEPPPGVSGQARDVQAPLGRPFELSAGHTAQVARESVVVRFERVTEDSRCPVGVTCVWEGDAVLRMQLDGPNGESVTVDLHTHANFDREAIFRGFRIRLLKVAPEREENVEIPPGKYIATLVVDRV